MRSQIKADPLKLGGGGHLFVVIPEGNPRFVR